MANDVEIKGKITVDSGSAAKSINEVRDSLKDARKEMEAAKIGSDEYIAAQKRLAQAQADLKKATDESNGSTSKSGEAFGILKEKLGSTVPGFKMAESGATSLRSTFKALAANPVILILTAIVLVLKAMYESFTNTFEGANKVEQVFAGLKATAQALFDNLGKIASAIKNVFTFNFSGAKKDIQEVADAAAHAYNQMSKLTKEAQELHREQLANDLDSAKRQQQLAILREQASDDSVPLAERKKALLDLKTAAEQNAKDDIALAKRTTENKIAQLTLQKDGEKKNQDEINKLKIAQIQVETDNANELRRINKQVTAIDKQEAADRKEIQAAEKQRRDKNAADIKEYNDKIQKEWERQQKLLADVRAAVKKDRAAEAAQMEKDFAASQAEEARIAAAEEKRLFENEKLRLTNKKKLAELDVLNDPTSSKNKIAKIKADLELELQALAEGDLQRSILAKKASDEILKIQTDETEAKNKLRQTEREVALDTAGKIGEGFGTLAELAGKQTVAGKALAIAQASITAIQGAINSYTSLSSIPIVGPVLGAIAAAGAIAAGIANIKKITAVQVPGKGGGGGGSAPSIATAAPPVTPQQMSTKLNQSDINKIGNAAAGGVNRSFVLDRDIKDNQERAAVIQRASRI